MNVALPSWLEASPRGIILHLVIQPKASKTEVVGPHGTPERLKVRVAAPPVDGEANEELLQFLKKRLKTTTAQLVILRGENSKMKDILCGGLNAEEAQKLLWPTAP